MQREHAWLADARERLAAGDTASAFIACERLLRADATHPDALMIAAALCASEGRAEEAERLLARGAAAHPLRVEFPLGLGRLRIQAGRHAEAVEALETCVLLQPHERAHRAALVALYSTQLFTTFSARSREALLACLRDDALRHDLLHKVWLSLLRADPEQQPLLRWLESPSYAEFCRHRIGPQLLELQANELLLLGLERFLLADLQLERGLTYTRRWLRENQPHSPQLLPLLCSLARYCYFSEFVFALEGEVAPLPEVPRTAPEAALLGCYVPLHRVAPASTLAPLSDEAAYHRLLRAQVLEPLTEQALLPTLDWLTPIRDRTSTRVRHQYEESPYPRWLSVEARVADAAAGAGKSVLVAGCGTGREAVELALRLPAAQVLGIDLSRPSLAYAARKALEHGVENLGLRCADLLELEPTTGGFDLVSCVGVLHHLEEPERGLAQLVRQLSRQGILRLGLYSTLARRPIAAARALSARAGLDATPAGVRALRALVFDLEDTDPIQQHLALSYDFYSLSSCRDLLFHVQEHTFTLLQLRDLFERCELSVLEVDVKSHAHARAFRARFPTPSAARDLESWHAYELENPAVFGGMYALWLHRRGQVPDTSWLPFHRRSP